MSKIRLICRYAAVPYTLCCLVCRLNAAEMFIDVAKTDSETATNWVAESGVLDLFLLLGPSPHQVIPYTAQSCAVPVLGLYMQTLRAILLNSSVWSQPGPHKGRHTQMHRRKECTDGQGRRDSRCIEWHGTSWKEWD